ncbi:hypothetical protein M5K25_024626 [Dendrobium thyrsiflorum]|uniref:Ubiquitin-like protease family profile domain-containing protein n=1 Tax=Dendrobium thyrsiflorum TaxID=117978 RepID=A0ABD0U2G1_DENTH
MPLMYELLKCWDSTEEGFKIKDHLLKFTTDEVAVLTGLPNTGAEIIWHNEPLGDVLSTELKSEMGQLSRSTDVATMLKTFICFVISNLFFPLNSLKTPRRLVSIASSLEEFFSINWAWTLREFMVNEFNRMATKLATEKPLGYINGFLPLLLVWFLEHVNVNTPRNPDSRPRFLRWEGNTNIFYSSEKAAHLVATLKEKQIVYILDGLSAEEADLVHADLTSFQPPPSPLKQKSHEPSDLPPAKKIRIKTSQKQKSPEHELPHESKEFQAAQAFAQPEWLSHLEERMHNLIDAVSRKIQKDIGDRIDKIEDNLQRVEGKDVVFTSVNVILTRRDIDHILLDDCLDNFHIDAYAFFVDRKTKAFPAIYQPYLYISPMHRILKSYNDYSDLYIKHIKKETLKRTNLLIIPIIHNNHWTLLVGRLKERVWKLYDSLPNPQHKEICVTVVNELYTDLIKCFDADITKWRINIVRGTPTQSNSFDCGMFVCKYMEKVVVKDKVDWSAYKYWQNEMPRYRTDFAYQILMEGESVELKHVKKCIESAAKAH